MGNGIKLSVVWFDEVEDQLQVLFRCSNGYFAGQAEIYVSSERLSDFGNVIRGFPSSPADSREFEVGTFNPEYADGGARMRFFCEDSAGHAVVEVKLRGGASQGMGEVESVALRIPIQAAAVDDFINQLQGLEKEIGAAASLRQAKA